MPPEDEPDGDPHGECVLEIARITQERDALIEAREAARKELDTAIAEWNCESGRTDDLDGLFGFLKKRVVDAEIAERALTETRRLLVEVEAGAAAFRAKVKDISEDFNPTREHEVYQALTQMREALGLALASSDAGAPLAAYVEAMEAFIAITKRDNLYPWSNEDMRSAVIAARSAAGRGGK